MRSMIFFVLVLLVAAPTFSGEPHWAYVRPVSPKLPSVKNKLWPRNAIDRFVLRRLEDKGLAPSRLADKTTLIRRVTLDLTGLPPTPQEVSAFLRDPTRDAYERVVDRLLRSPRYAERMTAWWLDMARYADTHGYEGDGARNIWLYRDWVINAFSRGMPFDQFTVEQLAGDLLPKPTNSQRIATGFHRNSPFCYEGGTDLEQFRVESVVDRVNTTMTVWMGTTFGCAQCHDHKYDPFSQKEYYQLYAFFNNSTESRGATFSSISPLQEGQSTWIAKRIAAIQKQIDSSNVAQLQSVWERKQSSKNLRLLVPQKYVSLQGASLSRLPDSSILVSGKNPSHDSYEIIHNWRGGVLSTLGLEVLHHKSLPKGGPGRYETNGNFGLSKLEVEISLPTKTTRVWKRIQFQHATASYEDSNDKVLNALNDQRACWCTNQKEGQAWFFFKEPHELPAGTQIKIRMIHKSKWQRHGVGRFRFWSVIPTRKNVIEMKGQPPLAVLAVLQKPSKRRTAAEQQRLASYFRSINPALNRHRNEIKRLKTALAPTSTMVMQERSKSRTTRVLISGSFLNPGKVVTASVPKVLHGWPKQFPRNRRGLAKWIVDRQNPLTARVTMNRIWAMLFGQGIVRTSEDFGLQGSPPTHPKLLDHLATEFMRSGWNLQAMQRHIVTSATYRQSSTVNPRLIETDAENRFYARGPAYRLDAEGIRDNALAISGLLDKRMGGPGVYPFQPQGVYEQIHSYTTRWATSQQGQQFRRALYIWWKRTAPYPSMITFDAPRRNVCTERRPRTNTPLQALVTLNDPVFVQCAAALGRRMRTEVQGSTRQRVAYGFQLCVSRRPTKREADELVKLYERALAVYRKKKQAAKSLAMGGLPQPMPVNVAVEELAAWTLVGNVLLNLDETLTKY